MEKIVLASGSPRRKELLAKTGVKFSVFVSGGEEKADTKDPAETVEKLSRDKASAVRKMIQNEKEPQLIIGADTVVAYDGQILGKPSDKEDAFQMLWKLQGETHQVYTGVTLLLKKEDTWQAHGIQGKFGIYVKGICGDYNNVVGLPVGRLVHELKKLGIDIRGMEK